MAATSGLYFQDSSLKPAPKPTADMNLEEASTNINLYHLAQMVPLWESMLTNETLFSREESPAKCYQAVKDSLKNSRDPIIITFSGGNAAHAVLAYKLIEVSGNPPYVYVYDSNFPVSKVNQDRPMPEIYLKPAQATWGNPSYMGYDWAYGDRISAHKVFRKIPLDQVNAIVPGLKKNLYAAIEGMKWAQLFNVVLRCPADAIFTDQQGRRFGTENGVFINEIPGAEVLSEGEVEIYQLPLDKEYSLSIAGTGYGELDFDIIRPEGEDFVHLLSFQNISVKSGTKITGSLDTGGKIQAIQSGSRTIQPTLNGTVDLTGFALISPEETEGERESISRDDHTSNVIYNSWNKDTVDNGPTCSPFFTIDEPMTITYIDTFHWNYGEGAPGGTIGLRDGDGTVHGPWQAESSREGGEVPRGYWIAHPNEVIPAGSYTIEDSDPDTWSRNSESPCGFAKVEGYAVDSTTPHESDIPAPETASAKGTNSRPPVASRTAEAGVDSSLGKSSMAEEELSDAGANPPATKKTISSSGKEILPAAKPERPSIEESAYYDASSSQSIEIRSQAATGDFEWTAQNFAGFYYDPNEDVGTEVLTATLREGKLSGSQPFGLYYQTTVQRHDFAFADWGSYQVLGFLGEKHLAGYAQGTSSDSSYIFDRSGDKSALAGGQLLKILLDDDSLKTITNDMPLQLEDGYVLVIKEIDIDSRNVFLELYKDGTAVDRKVLTPSKDGASMADKTYYYKKDIGNLKDVIIIAVHFKNAFRGADQDLATVDGLWQLSETPVYVAEGAEYDKMTVQSVTDDAITMANQGAEITLGRNKDVSIMPGMRIRTADADALRYYIYREITDPGTYEIRSTVETAEYAAWTAAQFAGFYYDLDQDIGTERLTAEITDGEIAEPDGIRYTTQASAVDFKFKDWGSYDVIGFLGEKRFAGYIDGSDSGKGLLFEKSSNKSALAKGQLLMVLLDDDSETTITSRSPLMLAEGYSLELKHIDPDDGRVYANLLKGDKLVKDYMFQPSKDDATISDKTCIFRNPSLGLVTIAVHFKNTFRGADQNLATIDGIWQISESPISVNRGTSFDKLTVSEVSDRSIVMNNIDRTITLSRDKNIALAGDIHLRTADTDSLKYYLVKEESPSGFSGIEGYAGASEDASLATSSNPMAPEVEKNLKEPVSTSDTTSASNSLDELIYSDDFSDINSGWSRASNRPDLDAWGYDDGRYHIIRKKPGQSWSSPPESPIFRDFAVEVEVNQEEGPDDNQYGLIFRRDASGNYYCFQISGAGNYRFDVNFDGKWREIVPDTWSSKINTGMDENVLRVVCSGERFIFYVNGAKIGEAQDSSIPSGRIGLVAGSLDDQRVHISFDNIKVWAL